MAWVGYFEFNGNELINAQRVEAYAATAKLGWFRPVYNNTDLRLVLSQSAYVSPQADNAPWHDTNTPVSDDFYGVYPLDVGGIEDSTATSNVIESLGNGGFIPKGRKATKTLVFSVVLVAASEAGAEYGMQWLKSALDADGCGSDPSCTGFDLNYFASEPHIGTWTNYCRARAAAPLTGALAKTYFQRTLRKVRLTVGASVTSRQRTHDGGCAWAVTFTLSSGSPYQFSPTVPLISGFMNAGVANPWVGGTPTGGTTTSVAYDYTEPSCSTVSYAPVYDPLSPGVAAPPQPPGLVWGGVTPPTAWKRRRFNIPSQFVPAWTTLSPVFNLDTTVVGVVRNLRLRIYEDPTNTGDMPSATPCNWCADILVNYIPSGYVMTIDASNETIYVLGPAGEQRRADAMVTSTSGGPIVWPALSCAIPYVVTVDVPASQTPPYLGLSLVGRSA